MGRAVLNLLQRANAGKATTHRDLREERQHKMKLTLALLITIPLLGQSQSNFIPVVPCRVADTRNSSGPFGGPMLLGNATRNFTIPSSSCSIPTSATAYSLNVSIVPPGPLGFLTLWPTGQPQPLVATLNDLEGQLRNNAAIVPAGASGAISVFVTNPTHLILDINGYYAPAVAGPAGPTGPQGIPGNTGPTGATGPQGPTGPQGLTGAQGTQGILGNTGSQGPAGTPGTQISCPPPNGCYGIVLATNPDGSTNIAVNSVVFPRPQDIRSTNGSVGFTGSGNPRWTNYTTYPVFTFTPDVNCIGGVDTLNVDNVGMVGLKINVNGVLQPTVAGSCKAGMPYLVIPHPSTASGNISGIDGFVIYQ